MIVFIILCLCIFGAVYFYVRKHMSLLHTRSWQAIVNQQLPVWFDERLLPVLKRKFDQRNKRSFSTLNMLYVYLSRNGKLGDVSWSFVERLCKRAVMRLPTKTFDYVCGISSGGALISQCLASYLGNIPCEYLSIQKYANNKGVFDRIKTYLFGAKKQYDVNEMECSNITHLKDKRVLLVDDQLASGSTMNCATEYLLQKVGATSVHRLVLASSKLSFPNCTIGVNNLLISVAIWVGLIK